MMTKILASFHEPGINKTFKELPKKEQDLIKELTIINKKEDKGMEELTSKEDRIILTKVIDSDFSFYPNLCLSWYEL